MDGAATCRVLVCGWDSLVTIRFRWLLTRNTGRNEYQGIPSWDPKSKRMYVERDSNTVEIDKSFSYSIHPTINTADLVVSPIPGAPCWPDSRLGPTVFSETRRAAGVPGDTQESAGLDWGLAGPQLTPPPPPTLSSTLEADLPFPPTQTAATGASSLAGRGRCHQRSPQVTTPSSQHRPLGQE